MKKLTDRLSIPKLTTKSRRIGFHECQVNTDIVKTLKGIEFFNDVEAVYIISKFFSIFNKNGKYTIIPVERPEGKYLMCVRTYLNDYDYLIRKLHGSDIWGKGTRLVIPS